VGILLIGLLSWLVLRSSEKVVGFLGVTGMNALTRIIVFLLVCVGVQFIVVGAAGFLTDEDLARPFVEMILRLSAD
jgi:multiple antibiotic resistance protein